jgi:hypothetical protein
MANTFPKISPRLGLTLSFVDMNRRRIIPMIEIMRNAGIAPATSIPQVVSPHNTCVENWCQWLHYSCTDAGLQDVVANWLRLTRDVRDAILNLARPGLE